MPVGRRRALVIGVGEFDAAVLREEPDLDGDRFDDLDFAVGAAADIAASLSGYRDGGFEVSVLENPDRTEIADGVQAVLDDTAATARVIHVISHGRYSGQADRVEVVGRCRKPGNNVREWVSSAQDRGIPTLFLVDLCGAGRAVNLNFVVQPDAGEQMAWVIAAALGDQNAYDGAFSTVVARVLAECGRTGLGVGAWHRFVPLREFARRIDNDLQRHRGQRLSATSVPLHDEPDLPFLPNPRWRPDPLADPAAALDAPLRPFLDDAVADANHFRQRAGAYFSGRQAELDRLVPWMDGAGEGGVWLVTGAAGAGKSALLGALVCAAHPQLASLVPHVRRLLDNPPAINNCLAAVHARQRTLDEIVASIARQLGLDLQAADRTAAALIAAIAAMPTPPVLAVDALDECPDASAVQTLLLLRLGSTRRADGMAAARLLVGARPWEQFKALRAPAEASRRLSDLDRVDPEQLQRDLRRFLLRVFDGDWYADDLATAVAARLAADHAARREEPATQRWGHFLVADRYAQYVQQHPPRSDAECDRLAAEVPTELPQVLELELVEHPHARSMRTALAALAHAKGDGMPVELLKVVAPLIGPIEDDEFNSTDIRVYLRHSEDGNGVSLLRLYHQGLADYLQTHPTDADHEQNLTVDVYDALRSSQRTQAGGTSWAHAPLYLRSHVIHHAADAGTVDELLADLEFLVYADPATLLPELDRATTTAGRLGAAMYRSVHHLLDEDPDQRRRLLTLAALRYRPTTAIAARPEPPW